ncbi:MAG: PEP-CTERM sorting domain-containing protein [Thermoguttaceae bacterium]|jgi:hypothetical protein
MKLKMIVMLLAMLLPITVNTAMGGIDYTINIFDNDEFIYTTTSPEGLPQPYIVQEGPTTPGEVYWSINHTIDAATIMDPYNIYEPEDPLKLSDTLYVALDHYGSVASVTFFSDSLEEGDISPLATTQTLPEVYTLSYPLSNGDNFVVHYESIPEPGALLLLGAAAISLMAYGWRRR